MFKFSAVSQIWKKYILKMNDWDLPLNYFYLCSMDIHIIPTDFEASKKSFWDIPTDNDVRKILNLGVFSI